jgi:predicted acylesterase/phospholipase RssA
MSGSNMLKYGRDVLGEHSIEDLLLPMFCVSTSLTRGGEVIHRTGDSGAAMRASGSVPGILPPLPLGDELLIDGGLSNNLPIDVAARLWGGKIVAVDVVPDFELERQDSTAEPPASVSGWKYLWRQVSPFGKKMPMPNILSIMFRTVTTSTQGLRNATELGAQCSLYLRPPVSRWNLMDFRAAGPIAAEGERATRADIETWWLDAKPSVMPNRV